MKLAAVIGSVFAVLGLLPVLEMMGMMGVVFVWAEQNLLKKFKEHQELKPGGEGAKSAAAGATCQSSKEDWCNACCHGEYFDAGRGSGPTPLWSDAPNRDASCNECYDGAWRLAGSMGKRTCSWCVGVPV